MKQLTLGRCRLEDILTEIGWSQQDLANYTSLDKTLISRFVSEDPKQQRKISLLAGIIITDTIYAKTGTYYHPRELYEGTQTPLIGRSGGEP